MFALLAAEPAPAPGSGASWPRFFYAWWTRRLVGSSRSSAPSRGRRRCGWNGPTTIARDVAGRSRVAALLLPLAWFKYYGFFALNVANAFESFGHARRCLLQVLLPIGISFYTFMAISYVVDVSRYQIQVSRWLDVSVYLAFFHT